MPREVPGPFPPDEMRRFLETYGYREEGFFIDEVLKLDPEARALEARMETTRPLLFAPLQRTGPHHPPHVSAPELLMTTGNLGCLHAWFFHGVRWAEGWAAFGSRLHRADFKNLARIGPPLRLESRETRTRVGPRRIVMRMEFHFWQGESLVYYGDQSAFFLKHAEFA